MSNHPVNYQFFSELIEERLLPRCQIVATGRQETGKEVSKCCDTLLQIGGFTEDHVRGFVTKYFKKRHDLAQLYLDMVECVLRKYKKKKGLLETEEELTDLYKPQLNRFGLVALNGLLNDKLDLNESELGNHAKDLTEFGFLA